MSTNKMPAEALGFTNYLKAKNLTRPTQEYYLLKVNQFENWYQNELTNCQKKDILNYLSYLKANTNQQTISRNNSLIALRHYFNHQLEQNNIAQDPTTFIQLRGIKRHKLKHIYNLEELAELADRYYLLEVKRTQENLKTGAGEHLFKRSHYAKVRNHTILLFFIHQGLHTREILRLRTNDIQLHKANVIIRKGTIRGNARNLPLHATQIGSLMQYINEIRPQLETEQTDSTLFLPLQKKDPKAKKQAQATFKGFTKKLKQLDRNFTSLVQLRASVITYWIKTYGLRKAQYLAGHKSIVSTEEYLPNDIEDLAEDITKFNPF